jgi:hypothetical protein
MTPLRSPNDLFRPGFIGKMDAFTAWVLRRLERHSGLSAKRSKGKADMKSSVKLAFSLFVGLFAVIELAHFASAQTTTLNAYVYVINRLNGPINELDGFSADSTGALTALPGSPFWTSTTASQFWTLVHTPN